MCRLPRLQRRETSAYSECFGGTCGTQAGVLSSQRGRIGGHEGAVGREADILHHLGWIDLRSVECELSGELHRVHQYAGLIGVDAGLTEGIADLRDGGLDTFGVFNGGELQALVDVAGCVEGFM